MTRKQWLAVVGMVVTAALLAFVLREAVNGLIVVPLAYLLWLLKLLYLSIHQSVWWAVTVIFVLAIIIMSLLQEIKQEKKLKPPVKIERGHVQTLADSLQRSRKGVYFKWSVANRLGRLAYQILLEREHGKPRSVFSSLNGDGWEAPPEIRSYLEAGLHNSFANFPHRNRLSIAPRQKTPFDLDVADVVEFLESKQGDGGG